MAMDAQDEKRMWVPSDSPEETWSDASGADENGEWPVHGVVGEEIRLADGSSRYEVRWHNWYRKDGSNTNTTWETENAPEVGRFIKDWKKKQARTRRLLADASLDMEVPWPDDAIHLRFTDHRRQGYAEKLAKSRQAGPTSPADWDAEIDCAHRRLQEPELGEENAKLRVRRANTTSASRSSASVSAYPTSANRNKRTSPAQSISAGPPLKRPRGRLPINGSPSSSPRSALATPSTSIKSRKRIPHTPNSAGSSKEPDLGPSTLPAVIVAQPTLRGRISSTWNRAAREAMAATVRISPEIFDEDVPRVLRKFKYLEKGYTFRDEALQETFEASRGAFTICDCNTCSDTSDCPCRDVSKIYDMTTKCSAYSKGLFNFKIPRGIDVVECNQYCRCELSCGNRVAQLPRSIGIEIFDTKRCGWGARALDDIPKGKVLGTYTGLLIRREEVDELPEEHHGYLFDLDSTEVRNSTNLGEKYSVDSYEHGNWTRFVNHSCSPNMRVYCVVYDTIPYVNMPYVAFVASTNIVAGTELTIDYCPFTEVDKKGKHPADGGDCRCGSAVCRGWFKP